MSKKYIGNIGGVPIIMDSDTTETHFRAPLKSDPTPQSSLKDSIKEVLKVMYVKSVVEAGTDHIHQEAAANHILQLIADKLPEEKPVPDTTSAASYALWEVDNADVLGYNQALAEVKGLLK